MKDTIKLFFFGDSIMLGQGVPLHQSWVSRISKAIWKKHGDDVITINASVNGNTTRMALERMPFDVQSHGVDIIVIQFGLNDCTCWDSDSGLPRVSLDAFQANLHEIISRAKRFGAKKVFLATNHPLPVFGNQINNLEYNKTIIEVFHEFNDVVLINIETIFLNEMHRTNSRVMDFLLEDNVHLNLKGHDLCFNVSLNIILNAVMEVL